MYARMMLSTIVYYISMLDLVSEQAAERQGKSIRCSRERSFAESCEQMYRYDSKDKRSLIGAPQNTLPFCSAAVKIKS